MKKYIGLFITGWLLIINTLSYGADRFWVAAANANWSHSSRGVTNWSTTSGGAGGASIPGTSDIAIFNSAVTATCLIDAVVNVAGFDMRTGYSGTVTQGAYKITIGTSNAIFTAGTFTGSSTGDSIVVNGTYTLAGSTFNSTSGYLYLKSTVTSSAGTFNKGTGTVEFASGSSQTVPAWNYHHLKFSGVGARAFTQGTTGIAGTFTKGSITPTLGGGTINYNGTGAQTIIAMNYHNLTLSGGRSSATITLATTGTIGIAGAFSNTTTSVVFAIAGSTVNYNGAGVQTVIAFNYNHLTISGARTTNSVTLANSGTIGIAGALTASATFTTTGGYIITNSTVDYNSTTAQTITAFNYYNLTISGARTANVTLASTGQIGIFAVFTKSATFSSTFNFVNTGSTINYNGSGQQTVMAFKYNNLTISGARTSNNNVILASSDTIKVARVFMPASTFTQGGNYVTTGSAVEFNGTLFQSIPAFSYNNLVSSSTGARTFASAGSVKIAGTFSKGTNVYYNYGYAGEGFIPKYTGVADVIYGISAVSSSSAFITGNKGRILKTTDTASTWSAQTSNTPVDLFAISFRNANNGLAVGNSGTITKTSNGGSTWATVTSGTSQNLRAVYYSTDSIVFAGGGSSTIRKSTNGGATWSSTTVPGGIAAIYGFTFTSSTVGYAVGWAGAIVKTTDGGSTWSSLTSGVTDQLASVKFISSDTGYAVGANGRILKTVNAGTSWSTITSGTTDQLSDIHFINNANAYIVGGNVANNTGTILKTNDGGTTWSTIYSGTYRFSYMSIVNQNIGFLSAIDGNAVKYTCCSDGGAVEFNGSGLQRIVGTNTNVKFNKLKINKSAGKLLLANPVEVGKQLIMTEGIIGTSSTNYLQINSTADTVIGGSDSSYVSGPMIKVGNQIFNFPLGDTVLASGAYHPLAISAPSVSTDAFKAQYFAANQTVGATLQPDSLESISNCEYFTLVRNAGTSTVIPTISWNTNSCNVATYDNLRVAYWDAGNTQWRTLGAGSTYVKGPTGTVAGSFGFGTATLYLAIGKFGQPSNQCAIVKRELDGGYHIVNNGNLTFKYDEEYNDLDSKLKFNIYTNQNVLAATNLTMPVASQPAVSFGDNRITLNIASCSFTPYGNLGSGFFILEVINEKNEKWYLRFKHNISIYGLCSGIPGGWAP